MYRASLKYLSESIYTHKDQINNKYIYSNNLIIYLGKITTVRMKEVQAIINEKSFIYFFTTLPNNSVIQRFKRLNWNKTCSVVYNYTKMDQTGLKMSEKMSIEKITSIYKKPCNRFIPKSSKAK